MAWLNFTQMFSKYIFICYLNVHPSFPECMQSCPTPLVVASIQFCTKRETLKSTGRVCGFSRKWQFCHLVDLFVIVYLNMDVSKCQHLGFFFSCSKENRMNGQYQQAVDVLNNDNKWVHFEKFEFQTNQLREHPPASKPWRRFLLQQGALMNWDVELWLLQRN